MQLIHGLTSRLQSSAFAIGCGLAGWWEAVREQQLLGSVERMNARTIRVAACQIDSHLRAINLQESSAIMFDRVHQTGRARNARHRADHARERLWRALAEQDNAKKR